MAPKGWIEPGRTAAEAATLEALEEAGAIGKIVEPELGRFTDINADGAPREVRVFALAVDRVLDHWQEESTRRRKWMTVEEATEAVCKHGLAGLLEKLEERLKP